VSLGWRQQLAWRATVLLDRVVRSGPWRLVPGDERRFAAQVRTARLLRTVQHRREARIDTALPGRALLAVAPDAVARLASRLPDGVVTVSATNGKTTTVNLLAGMLEAAGRSAVVNRLGENQDHGLATEMLVAWRGRGRLSGDLGVFEVDELSLPPLVPQLRPRVVVLGNLFRDQLDRAGELDTVASQWATMLDVCDPGTAVVLCADDPRVSALAGDRPGVVRFGVSPPAGHHGTLAEAADPPACARCGATLTYDSVLVGHLGHHRCPACGRSRPQPEVEATDVELHGLAGSDLVLRTPNGSVPVRLAVPGLFNVYNAVAAAAAAWVLGVPLEHIAAGAASTRPSFGRAEAVEVDGTRVRVLLTKNPTSMNEVLRLLAAEAAGRALDVLFLLNDGQIDGRDVSWIWDADVEDAVSLIRRVTCGGSRASSLAVRLKYAGVDAGQIAVAPPVPDALRTAVASTPDELFVVSNYSAMLELRELLAEEGHAERYWR
jgi:UDP-N-acetylmuramyl tripeptide synthase